MGYLRMNHTSQSTVSQRVTAGETPTELFLRELERTTGKPATPKGKGQYLGCCPGHNDGRPSLSVGTGADGRCLVKCFAGCSVGSIVAAVGLRLADLMPPSNGKPQSRSVPPAVSHQTPRYKRWCYQKAAHSAAMSKGAKAFPDATRLQLWHYWDATGLPVFSVCRFDLPDGLKEYRPLTRTGGCTWKFRDPAGKLPLYRLPVIAAADPAETIFVTEGEKCCEAMKKCGLFATTSAHGSAAASKTDWSPLTSRNIIIIADNDAAGMKYARAVAAILVKMGASVRIVTMRAIWPDCPAGGDIADLVEQHPELSDDEIRKRIERAAGAAEPVAAGDGQDDLTIPWEPFPVDCLPGPMRSYVIAAAAALGCDEAFIAPHLLAAVAAAIGNSRRIKLKSSWCEPAVIWAVVVASSGTLKSPAWELAVRPMQARQTALFAEWKSAMEQFERDKAEFDADLAEWKKSGRKQGRPMPEPPERPVPERLVISDATAEAVASVLDENPRGVLLARDEVSGFVNSMDGYKSARGVDVTMWLSVHRAGAVTVDRKTGKRITHIPRANVSVCGTTQPGTLAAALAGRYSATGEADAMDKPAREHVEDGLAARFLMCRPPVRTKRWTEAVVSSAVEGAIDRMFTRLLLLEMKELDDGRVIPIDLEMTPDGKAAWIQFYNEHAYEMRTLSGDMAAVYSKAECHAARLALLHHLALHAGDPTLPDHGITAESIRAGVTMSRWFCREAGRIYADIGGCGLSPEQQEQFDLLRIIREHGGHITARDLMRSCRKYRESADVAEAALSGLVEASLGRWETAETGGRQKRVFILLGGGDGDTSPLTPQKTGLLSPSPAGALVQAAAKNPSKTGVS